MVADTGVNSGHHVCMSLWSIGLVGRAHVAELAFLTSVASCCNSCCRCNAETSFHVSGIENKLTMTVNDLVCEMGHPGMGQNPANDSGVAVVVQPLVQTCWGSESPVGSECSDPAKRDTEGHEAAASIESCLSSECPCFMASAEMGGGNCFCTAESPMVSGHKVPISEYGWETFSIVVSVKDTTPCLQQP